MTQFIEAKINVGWFGGSAVNKMNNLVKNQYSDWDVVNAVPNKVNPVRTIIFGITGLITFGFYVPTAGYVIILKK